MTTQPARYSAQPDSLSQDIWSVVQGNGLVYEEMTEQEARIAADLLNENPALTWDEIEPLMRERIAKTQKKAKPAATDRLELAAQILDGTDEDDPRQNHNLRVQWVQAAALIAIAQKLRRFNDRAEAREYQTDSTRIWNIE